MAASNVDLTFPFPLSLDTELDRGKGEAFLPSLRQTAHTPRFSMTCTDPDNLNL